MIEENIRSKFAMPEGIDTHPDMARFLSYCRDLAGERDLPRKSDFRPTQIRWLLEHIYLVDVLNGGADYRCRLWGLFWETIIAHNLTGMRLSELESAGQFTYLRAEYDAIVANRKPRFGVGQVVWPDNACLEYARMIVPFTDETGAISMLLCAATTNRSLEDLIFFKGLGIPGFVFESPSEVNSAACG